MKSFRYALTALILPAILGVPLRAHASSTATPQIPLDPPLQTLSPNAREDALKTVQQLPLQFEVNQGQTDAQVNFLTRGAGYSVFLTPNETVLSFQKPQSQPSRFQPVEQESPEAPTWLQTTIRSTYVGANTKAQGTGLAKQPGISNYLIGTDKSRWQTNVAHYSGVEYQNLYPGVDLRYSGQQSQLTRRFAVAAGADPHVIQLQFQGVESITLDHAGNLLLKSAQGTGLQTAPRIWQQIQGQTQPVSGQYVLQANQQVGFAIGDYNPRYPLQIEIETPLVASALETILSQQPQLLAQATITPIVNYSTYLGGTANDYGGGIAVDLEGNTYIIGTTNSVDFPTLNPLVPTYQGGNDIFITKLNAAGNGIVYSTFVGGTGIEAGHRIALDYSKNVYFTGYTTSFDFPTSNPLYPNLQGIRDGFIAKLNASGTGLDYSTYLGGSGDDIGNDIVVDRVGNAYVTGSTTSPNFPTANPINGALQGTRDGFVSKMNPFGTGLDYSTYLGGNSIDLANGIAVDRTGNVVVVGSTSSTNFPVANALYPGIQGAVDGFVSKLNAAGNGFVYSTYLGGSASDIGRAVAIDLEGNTYITGATSSPDFPTVNPVYPALQGITDGFVSRLKPAGNALSYSTYLGGNASDVGFGLDVDAGGNAYVTGATNSSNFPTVNPLYPSLQGGVDVFLSNLNSTGTGLRYSTYFGGTTLDATDDIAVDVAGNTYLTGDTLSANFPTLNPLFPNLQGDIDGFVSKVGTNPLPTYIFDGYFAPLKSIGVANSVQAGRIIPVRWRMLNRLGEPISDPSFFVGFSVQPLSCSDLSVRETNVVSEFSETFPSFLYLGDGVWEYNWWVRGWFVGTCSSLNINFSDGSQSPPVVFEFTN